MDNLRSQIEIEAERIAVLKNLNVLDTSPDWNFDGLVTLAAAITQTPMAALSLVDTHRQWFKSSVGIDFSETPREIAFCDHTIRTDEPLIVGDASTDARFFANPMVTGDLHLRFYAGIPVEVHGEKIGSFCVMDREARKLSPHQFAALTILAGIAASMMRKDSEIDSLRKQLAAANLTAAA